MRALIPGASLASIKTIYHFAIFFSLLLQIPVVAYLCSLCSSLSSSHSQLFISRFTSRLYCCCRRSHFVMAYTSAKLILHFAVLSVSTSGFLFGKVAILSPSSNVHVDVMNHVASSLDSHAQSFHSTWRDYSLLFLLVVFCFGTVLLCCGIVFFCFYRGVLFRLRNRSASTTQLTATSAHRITPSNWFCFYLRCCFIAPFRCQLLALWGEVSRLLAVIGSHPVLLCYASLLCSLSLSLIASG
jgi:hypothetical protein